MKTHSIYRGVETVMEINRHIRVHTSTQAITAYLGTHQYSSNYQQDGLHSLPCT